MNPTHSRLTWPALALVLAAALLAILTAARRRTAARMRTHELPATGHRARLAETGERCTVLRHLAEVRIDGLADPVTVRLADLEQDSAATTEDRASVQLVALEVGREVWFVPASTPSTARVGTVIEIAEFGAVKLREQSGRIRWADQGAVLAIVGEAVADVDAGPVADEQPAEHRQAKADTDFEAGTAGR